MNKTTKQCLKISPIFFNVIVRYTPALYIHTDYYDTSGLILYKI